MDTQLQFFQWTRQNINELLEPIGVKEANTIPPGLKNNIAWNSGHIIFVHQILVYQLTGQAMIISDDFVKRYVTGTKPTSDISQDEWSKMKSTLLDTTVQTVADFESGKFNTYTPFSAKYGSVDFHFTTFEESFAYNNLHEALHLGYLRALRNALGK